MALATRCVVHGPACDRIQVAAPTAGSPDLTVVVVRSGATGMIGVRVGDAAASTAGTVDCGGVFELPKATGTVNVATAGDIAYWDTGDGNIQKVASANIKAGIFAADAAAAATVCLVRLLPSKA